MIRFGMSGTGHVLAVEHVQVVAHYDRVTGDIKHVHMVTTLTGATPPSHDEAIVEAKQLADRHISGLGDLAIALSNNAEHGQRPHRIDLETVMFVPLYTAK